MRLTPFDHVALSREAAYLNQTVSSFINNLILERLYSEGRRDLDWVRRALSEMAEGDRLEFALYDEDGYVKGVLTRVKDDDETEL